MYEKGGNSTPDRHGDGHRHDHRSRRHCLTNQNSLNTEGNPICLSGCNGSAGPDTGRRTATAPCGSRAAASTWWRPGTTSGTQVDWYACNGSNAQNWTHQANGELVNPNSGLCLTDPGGNTGTRLDIETCTGAAAAASGRYPTGGGGTNTVTVTSPGNQTTTVGTAASLQIHASDSASGQTLTYSATRPAGRSVDQLLLRPDLRHADRGRHLERHGDRQGRHRRHRITSFTWTVNSGGGGTCGTTNLALNKTDHRVLDRERRHPGRRRDRRQHRHPLVVRLHRPAVAPGRPRRDETICQVVAELGDRVRHGLPDPDVDRRHELDHDLLHDHRHRRHTDPQRHRFRPLRPDLRHRPRNPVRRLHLGVQVHGSRRRAAELRHHEPAR